MRQAPTWYSVVVEIGEPAGWRELERWTQAWDIDSGRVAQQVAGTYSDGSESPLSPLRVRVYAGYNRYDELLAELRTKPEIIGFAMEDATAGSTVKVRLLD